MNRTTLAPPPPPPAQTHINPFGVIPKKHKPGKWRLIVDLSAPEGHSVNDFVDKELCLLSYISVDDVARVVLQLGQGTLMAKADIKEAFRTIPVHPADRWLLGMQWEGQVLVDKVLPFGLRSAPLIFTAVADAMEWVIRQRRVQFIFHYVDDFIFVGKPLSSECASNLSTGLLSFAELGAPIEPDKCEGPATCLTILGIDIDTRCMQLRLPREKLSLLREATANWRGRKSCTKRELLSLIGTLQHATKVIKPGRAFVRRMIELSKARKRMEDYIRLNTAFRSDIEWWHHFASTWNGVSILAPVNRENPDGLVVSDASGQWGCGAFHGQEWFQLQWDHSILSMHITIKELLPVMIAAAVWGKTWSGKTIMALSDNAATVQIITQHHSKDPTAMHLVRCLTLIECHHDFSIVSKHIPGHLNTLADALSRDNLPYFLSHCPQASATPTTIPLSLVQALIISRPDWTSVDWPSLLKSISNTA